MSCFWLTNCKIWWYEFFLFACVFLNKLLRNANWMMWNLQYTCVEETRNHLSIGHRVYETYCLWVDALLKVKSHAIQRCCGRLLHSHSHQSADLLFTTILDPPFLIYIVQKQPQENESSDGGGLAAPLEVYLRRNLRQLEPHFVPTSKFDAYSLILSWKSASNIKQQASPWSHFSR